jgi:hypothetical protein
MESESPGRNQSGHAAADQEQQLLALKSELREYQDLIDDIPSLYEAKFRYRVQDVAQDIRRLMEERQCLQEQIRLSLQGQATAAPLSHPPKPRPRRWALAALVRAKRRLRRLPRWQLALAAGAGALALAVPLGLGGSPPRGRSAPGAPAASSQPLPEASPQLRHRAE